MAKKRKANRVWKRQQRRAVVLNKVKLARTMKRNPTWLERILYGRIRAVIGSRTHIHLETQVIECGYILDAYIPELHIAFEADGPFHKPGYDAHRDWVLRKHGIKVVRFGQEELRRSWDEPAWQNHVDEILEFHLGRSILVSN